MRAVRSPYTSTLYFWDQVSAMFYASNITPFHSHNTMQLVVDLGGSFRFRTTKTGWKRYRALVIREDVVHRLDTCGSVQLIVYLDASSDVAGAIKGTCLSGREFAAPPDGMLLFVRPGALEQSLIQPNKILLREAIHQILDELRNRSSVNHGDVRVREAMNLLSGEDPAELSIGQLSKRLCLSESRLRCVFRREAGISLHKYIVLRRIGVAISGIINGWTIAEAAAGAGFTDSSHLHRALLQTFGKSPSQFMKDNNGRNVERLTDTPLRLETRRFEE